MKEIKIVSDNSDKKITLNLPTSLEDISVDYLKDCVECVDVPDEHSIIGIVYRNTLSELLLLTKKQQTTTNIIPIFVKSGATSSNMIESAKTREKVICTGTDLARGYHVISPGNVLNPDYISSLLSQNKNNYATMYDKEYSKTYFYFVEFKLVPNCDIHGVYKDIPVKTNKFVRID